MPRAYRIFLSLFGVLTLTGCSYIEEMRNPTPPIVALEPPVYCYRALAQVTCYPTAQPESIAGDFIGTQQPQRLLVIQNEDGTTSAVEADAPASAPPSWPMPPHP